jgi:hypothetical protein
MFCHSKYIGEVKYIIWNKKVSYHGVLCVFLTSLWWPQELNTPPGVFKMTSVLSPQHLVPTCCGSQKTPGPSCWVEQESQLLRTAGDLLWTVSSNHWGNSGQTPDSTLGTHANLAKDIVATSRRLVSLPGTFPEHQILQGTPSSNQMEQGCTGATMPRTWGPAWCRQGNFVPAGFLTLVTQRNHTSLIF